MEKSLINVELSYAVTCGDLREVQRLCDCGANVNYTNNSCGDTPIMVAAAKGYLDLCVFLCKQGANVTVENRYGDTPIMVAASCGYLEIVKVFCNHGVDINRRNKFEDTTIMLAADEGHLDIVKYLVDLGADINCRNKYGYTPVIIAARNNNLAIVKYLRESGADINRESNVGTTPINVAATWGHLQIVQYLYEQGANVNFHSRIIGNALLIAARNDHVDIVRYLCNLPEVFIASNWFDRENIKDVQIIRIMERTIRWRSIRSFFNFLYQYEFRQYRAPVDCSAEIPNSTVACSNCSLVTVTNPVERNKTNLNADYDKLKSDVFSNPDLTQLIVAYALD